MSHRRLRAIIASAILLAIGTSIPLGASAATETPLKFQDSQHYDAGETLVEDVKLDGQSTLMGTQIAELTYHDGRVYAGYGDYTDNTGPINLYSYDGISGDSRFEITVPTESIENITPIGGNLFIPYIDPKAPWTSPVGYATDRGGSWKNVDVVPMIHHYDMATTDGTNLFMAGSVDKIVNGKKQYFATIWYSADGSTNWTKIRERTSTVPRDEFDRYYWMEAQGGKLYAMADVNGVHQLDIWENGSWSTQTVPADAFSGLNVYRASDIALVGDNLISTLPVQGATPRGELLNTVYSITENTLVTDRATVESTMNPAPDNLETTSFKALERRGSTVYGISSDGRLYSSTDGISWKYIMGVGSSTQHFSVDEISKTIYMAELNGGKSTIKKANMPQSRNTPPEISFPQNPVTIPVGSNWDPLAGVRAFDAEDGDLTGSIATAPKEEDGDYVSAIDTSKPGRYVQLYAVSDSKNGSTTVGISVVVGQVIPGGNDGSVQDGMCVVASSDSGQRSVYGDMGCKF